MATDSNRAATVILVHGLWMTGMELRLLGRRLESRGFAVCYFRYSTLFDDLGTAAARLRAFAVQQRMGRVHLVGHSLGGIVIARMLEEGELPALGRIVLLGSPQQGSRLAAVLAGCFPGRLLLGPVAVEGIVRNRPAPPVGRKLLVVAGTLSFGFARFFGVAAPNDGTVAAVETDVPGADVFSLRVSHMGMLFSRRVAAVVANFLNQN